MIRYIALGVMVLMASCGVDAQPTSSQEVQASTRHSELDVAAISAVEEYAADRALEPVGDPYPVIGDKDTNDGRMTCWAEPLPGGGNVYCCCYFFEGEASCDCGIYQPPQDPGDDGNPTQPL